MNSHVLSGSWLSLSESEAPVVVVAVGLEALAERRPAVVSVTVITATSGYLRSIPTLGYPKANVRAMKFWTAVASSVGAVHEALAGKV